MYIYLYVYIHTHTPTHMYMALNYICSVTICVAYEVATSSRLLKIIGLFCKRAL